MPELVDRITIDSAICHGKPCIRRLRYPVEVILELLSAGETTEDILRDYENLEREDGRGADRVRPFSFAGGDNPLGRSKIGP